MRISATYLLLAAMAVSACSARVDTPGAKVRGDGFEVDINNNNGKFCPPGQAKKGRC